MPHFGSYIFFITICVILAGSIAKTKEEKRNLNLPHDRAGSVESLVHFVLYTRNNRAGYVMGMNDQNFFNSGFGLYKVSKFLVHGWIYKTNASDHVTGAQAISDYLERYDCNVVTVEWGDLAGGLNDTKGVENSGPVGDYFGRFLNYIISKGGNANLFHLIGHGLGAHVSGYAGAVVFNNYGRKVARISGLDPTQRFRRPLAVSDGAFVDAIHTSIYSYGLNQTYTVDFYPTKGVAPQPGCGGFYETTIACSHFRSIDYFVRTIKEPNKFLATRCISYSDYKEGACRNESTTYMGEAVSLSARGRYFLSTY